jgi:hypothetical protein
MRPRSGKSARSVAKKTVAAPLSPPATKIMIILKSCQKNQSQLPLRACEAGHLRKSAVPVLRAFASASPVAFDKVTVKARDKV